MLNAEWFATTRQAQVVINTRLRQYNHIRPHHALGMRPPVPETLLEKPQISGPDQGGRIRLDIPTTNATHYDTHARPEEQNEIHSIKLHWAPPGLNPRPQAPPADHACLVCKSPDRHRTQPTAHGTPLKLSWAYLRSPKCESQDH
ncbi:MAG: transposase [Hyphomicrobiaceae bacterium]|nr:transposase [Hyphomicrobiaceae bacterium]